MYNLMKTIRMMKDFNQSLLAEKAEMTQARYGDIEGGIEEPTKEEEQRICSALGRYARRIVFGVEYNRPRRLTPKDEYYVERVHNPKYKKEEEVPF